MNGNFLGRMMWGLFIVVMGIALLLDQGGVVNFDLGDVFKVFWPVLLLIFGLQELVKHRTSGGGSWGGAIIMIVGFVFLGRNLNWFNWSMGELIRYAVPFVIILVGIRLIVKPKPKEKPTPPDDWKAYNYPPSDRPVPPAPPLHPDPTKPAEPKSTFDLTKNPAPQQGQTPPDPFGPGAQSGNGANPGSEPGTDPGRDYEGPRNPHEQQYYHEKMERWARKAERLRERMEHRAHRVHRHHGRDSERHDRVEWWNQDPNAQNRSGFIGDIYVGQDYWELKPMNISHFIGDTVLDLTKAQIPFGVTKINISSFIGDVKVFLPNDFEVGCNVISSAFIGDVAVLDRKEGGIFKNMNVETAYFQETDKKIKLVVSTFIGDVRVTKVG
ncbi:cell wall-active antibiotics response protein LiaF [Paenibacillus sepulcri]|uniref:Cell wall-active antibiotics response protein n=1 Tax=Paenibacillus sepulcri TaxID=359917 RepID=A0ABS7C7Q3_9BACL|nr:cell wall-active antibiotics response protein [Paenibacillus sepulcri]